MKEIIKKHFQSKGFKTRLFNWYLPALKMGLTGIYRKIHGYFERRFYLNQYQSDKVIDLDMYGKKPATGFPAVPTAVEPYEKAVEIMRKYQIGHSPQYLGTCVANTVKNSIRFASKVAYGTKFDLSEGDVYIDRDTLPQGQDGGMYPDRAFKRVAEKGIAISGIVPTAKTLIELKKVTRKEYPDQHIQPYRIKPLHSSKFIAGNNDFESLGAYITNEYAKGVVRPFQASITSFAGWWGSDVPKATGEIYGAHSITGVTIPFMYGNERAFFVIDSAYYTGTFWRVGVGIRIVTESTWRKLGRSVRKIQFVHSIENKLKFTNDDVLPPVHEKITSPARMGDNGEQVAIIQEALIQQGFNIPAGATGFYGEQTAKAVKEGQLANWRAFSNYDAYGTQSTLAQLNGQSFGNISVKVMNNLLA